MPTARRTPTSEPAATRARRAWVALGANLGDRQAAMRTAVQALAAHDAIHLDAVSPLYASPAHTMQPTETQPDYYNAVIALTTTLEPDQLLALLHTVENQAGRVREDGKRWQPRSLDLDILHVDGVWRNDPHLCLPHPRMEERRFVLQPLADLAPSLYVPDPYQATVADLLAACPDPSELRCIATTWTHQEADRSTETCTAA